MIRTRHVATPFGVRVDHLGPDDEPVYSEYVSSVCEMPAVPAQSRNWRRLALASLGLWAGVSVPLVVALIVP